ncbi:hypothetical protein AT251_22785 [Enterovibrio nigricans]|nr:hypothetical protein [Enterovibrio nigricans]PKF48903.1 hypothetical protein AT251_22785 [Enterovibrio nigricans]
MSDTQFLDIKEKARGYLNDLQGVSFEKRFCIKTVTFSLRGFLEAEYGDLVFRWPSQEELDGDKSLHAILERISSEDNVLSAGKLSKKEIINFRNRRFVVSAEGRVYVLEGYRDSKVYLREFDLESGWQWKELDIDDFIAQEKPQVIRVVSKKADDAPFGWKWFFALLKVNSSLFNTAIVCSLIIGVLSLAMPFYFSDSAR